MLQDLYDSEINFAISCHWDGGFGVRLGGGLYNDEKNWQVSDNVRTFEEAEEWIKQKAFEFYPDSVFTKKYNND